MRTIPQLFLLLASGCFATLPSQAPWVVAWVNVSTQVDGKPVINGANGIALGNPPCIPGGALNLAFEKPAKTRTYAVTCSNSGPGPGSRTCTATGIGEDGFRIVCFAQGQTVATNLCNLNINIACHVDE